LVCGLIVFASSALLLAATARRDGRHQQDAGGVSPYAAPLQPLLLYLSSHPDEGLTPIVDELLRAPVVGAGEARSIYHSALGRLDAGCVQHLLLSTSALLVLAFCCCSDKGRWPRALHWQSGAVVTAVEMPLAPASRAHRSFTHSKLHAPRPQAQQAHSPSPTRITLFLPASPPLQAAPAPTRAPPRTSGSGGGLTPWRRLLTLPWRCWLVRAAAPSWTAALGTRLCPPGALLRGVWRS
jgi:hypothetical protein